MALTQNQQGVVRTLEAALALLLLLGFVYFIIPEPTTPTGHVPFEVREAQRFVLKEISLRENDLRQCVMNPAVRGACSFTAPPCNEIPYIIEKNTPAGFSWACEVCDAAITCSDGASLGLPLEKTVYADSVLLTKEGKSKIIRVYFYEREPSA